MADFSFDQSDVQGRCRIRENLVKLQTRVEIIEGAAAGQVNISMGSLPSQHFLTSWVNLKFSTLRSPTFDNLMQFLTCGNLQSERNVN